MLDSVYHLALNYFDSVYAILINDDTSITVKC